MKHGIVKTKGDLRPKTLGGVVRYVGTNCTYTTIQSALDVCNAGDTVLVAPGTYTEAITYTQDNLTLKALGSYLDTTITQTAAQVVSFSSYKGCILEGFTVSISAADGNTDRCIYSAHTTGTNIIRNCNVTWASSVEGSCAVVQIITAGELTLENCTITGSNTYTGTNTTQVFGMYFGTGTLNVRNCKIIITSASTTTPGEEDGIITGDTTAVLNCWDTYISVTSAGLTTHQVRAWSIEGTSNIYNCYGEAIATGSGIARGVYGVARATCGIYNSTIKAITGDSDGECFYSVGAVSTMGIYGCTLKGDLTGTLGTQFTLYGTPGVNNAGYKAVSSATTGGSGTAGSGKQYVEVKTNGVTYKALYET